MKHLRTVLLILLGCILYPAMVLADTVANPAPASPSSWQSQLLSAAVAFLGAILSACSVVVFRYLVKKFHLDALGAREELYDGIIQKAIHFAEEQAYKQIQSKLPAKSGSDKMDVAVSFALARINDLNLPQKGAEAIKNLVESKLGSTRTDSDLTPPIPVVAIPVVAAPAK